MSNRSGAREIRAGFVSNFVRAVIAEASLLNVHRRHNGYCKCFTVPGRMKPYPIAI